ncbi:MAG: glycosyl transferase family 1, partial [Bryobacteraceae bacterium]
AWTGTGEVVPFGKIHTHRLGDSVRRVFEDPKYQANAQHLQAAIRRSGGVEAAADLTEAILGRA